ncbi:hypothetical protein M422DRAFT_242138 [Sphaerobolus stellatus SS14]|nr:hypothetical protein M422DRAFT_242138 [Sphaerobolus stellatus SS14]
MSSSASINTAGAVGRNGLATVIPNINATPTVTLIALNPSNNINVVVNNGAFTNAAPPTSALFHLPSTAVLTASARPFSETASLVLSIFAQCQSTSRPQVRSSSAENYWLIVDASVSNTLAVPTIPIIRTPSPAHPQPT